MRINIFITIFLITGCAGFSSLETTYSSSDYTATENNRVDHDNQEKLIQIFQRYKGTPYQHGGSSSDGFDCSGFIQTVMTEAFHITTPRTTAQLARSGKPVRRDQLQVGDILIFKSSIKKLHAGIYIGNDQFIHASTSAGVTRSKLDRSYWLQHYLQARRYL
ncbi:MAG: NlpC/P60 family protein [Reinekea sp.]|jgi:cell wall-associated NlpC family hydrolase